MKSRSRTRSAKHFNGILEIWVVLREDLKSEAHRCAQYSVVELETKIDVNGVGSLLQVHDCKENEKFGLVR